MAISVAPLSRTLRQVGITLKKVLRASESEQEPTKRAAWRMTVDGYEPAGLVFVHESGTNLAMIPRYGWAPRSQRVICIAPRNHGKNTTLMAALMLEGICAAMMAEGAMDRAAFEGFLAQILSLSLEPKLR